MSVTGDQIVPAMFYFSTTSAIPWEDLQESRKSGFVLMPRERCELLLRAVNGDSLPVRDWHRLVGARVQDLPDDTQMGLFRGAIPALKVALNRVVEEPATAIQAMGLNAAEIVNGEVAIFPEFSRVDSTWVIRERVIAHSVGAALVHALTLFLDASLEFGRLLRRCSFAECGRFAFGDPPDSPGQPPNFYCNKQHRLDDKRARARERVAAKRAGMSVAAWRRKRK
jgi:hypothetical protein